MARSIVTPQDLKDFAHILQKNIDDFNEIERSMNAKLHGYEWKDAVAAKFKNDFEATKEPINNLRLKMNEFIPYLNNKAAVLESEYLNV